MALETTGAPAVRVRPAHPGETFTLPLQGAPELIIGLLVGKIDQAAARSRGLKIEGDHKLIARFA